MPELKNVFHAGRMNKDLDERLIPNGEYRDALNIDVSFSESNDSGAAQNSYGNIVKSTVGITGAVCIGSIANKNEETIIWFISGTTVDAIVEYNTITNEVLPILVDTNKANSNAFLNFSEENLITGINILDDFLFFTDNNSEPKKINIGRMKNGSTNFSTTTKYQNADGTYTNNVYEQLITVIKKYPLNAPELTLNSSIRTGNVKGISHTLNRTTYAASAQATTAQMEAHDYLSKNIMANTAGSSTIYNITHDRSIERVCNNHIDDANNGIISFDTTGFTTGDEYKKWRAIEPGMKVAISNNGSSSWQEPVKYHTIKTVDWLNHTITVDTDNSPYNAAIESTWTGDRFPTNNPANSTKVRISHWSRPYNNDYFWAYTDDTGAIVSKPIGTSSDNYIDSSGNVLKDGGVLQDGSGADVAITASTATSGTGVLQFENGWTYNTSDKEYVYNGGGNSAGTYQYPKITKPTDLLSGHIYRMEATITITSGSGHIGFLDTSDTTVATLNGLNGRETRKTVVGTHNISITWEQAVSGDDGMLCLFATDSLVAKVKINSITCLSKPRVVKTQPIQFYGDTNYEVNDIIKLQTEDSAAVNYDDDKFVDITIKLTEKIAVRNNTKINETHALAIGSGVTGNEKISNGNLSDLSTWHTGVGPGTTDVTSSSAGFRIASGALTSVNSGGGYIRNVLAEDLVAGETYKLTYTVDTASTGSGSGSRGYLLLILADSDKYTGDDLDYGHSNHILLPTDSTGTKTVYFKQKSLERGAWNSGTTNQHGLKELKFYNDTNWNGEISNIQLKKADGTAEIECGSIGTSSGRQAFDFEILSIDSSILSNLGSLTFVSKRVQQDSIYTKEFPRFSYRWKYIDNEFSAISPFTEVAFLPKSDEGYSYDAKNGYNKSMVNDLRRITLSGIKEMPEDVKSIDILYKKSDSTSVYIVRTIESSEFEDLKENDSVVLTSEEIKSLLPENQMLRPYDNVPRKAKAQEITANRVLYGNYLQQYNYFNTPPEFKVKINSSIVTSGDPKKSLKSIRDYQVGIVYMDEYGRQSPVFTDKSGIIKLDQTKAATQNSIQCGMLTPPPSWATHYKYYVKDSSNEFYNIAMDRFYSDTEDENVWISFPSSEINKINENDYIALKKQHDSEKPVSVPSGATLKYKILDKQAEPPTHIKFKMERIGGTNEGVSFSAGAVVVSSDSNAEKNAKYDLQVYKYPVQGQSQFLVSAYDLRSDTELLEELESYITDTGVWYGVDNRFIDITSTLSGAVSVRYEILEIYKKTIINNIPQISPNPYTTGITDKGNLCLIASASGSTAPSNSITFKTNKKSSKSNDTNISNPDGSIQVGMKLVDSEHSVTYDGQNIIVTAVGTNSVTLSSEISQTDGEEMYFRDCSDCYYFKVKKPFGTDIQFVGQGPQPTKIELNAITDGSTSSYNATTTVLPNPQDLKLKLDFYKQTTDDYGEEFKGKFFVKIKRDGAINRFIYKTQEVSKTFKSRDSARLFYAQTWLLDAVDRLGNGANAIIPDTNLSTSSDYIREILDVPSDYAYIAAEDGFNQSWARSNYQTCLKNFGYKDFRHSGSGNARRFTGEWNGNGLSLNPITNIPDITYSPNLVGWSAAVALNGTPTKINFGGTTRGIYNHTTHTGQDSITGYSMKELNYTTPSLSGGSSNPMFLIDQSVSFILKSTPANDMYTNVTEDQQAEDEKYTNHDAYPYVGDGFQVGKSNCTFKIVGIDKFIESAGVLGHNAYNFFTYLKTKGQTFRFTNDPTNTVYTIMATRSAFAVNTQCVDRAGQTCMQTNRIDPFELKYYEKAIIIEVELDKSIRWSPFEETDSQGQPVNVPLELSTTSGTYAVNDAIGTGAVQKANEAKTASTNGSVFSACEIDFGEAKMSSESPAVFEVLPKEKLDLNLFYETPVTRMVVKTGMSVKTDYRTPNGDNPLHADAVIVKMRSKQNNTGNVFQIDPAYVLHNIPAGEKITICKKDQNGNILFSQNVVLEIELLPPGSGIMATKSNNFNTVNAQVYNIIEMNQADLKYYNCFAFGNGVESNRIFDDYNEVTIDKGPRVSTILESDYKEERKANGIIYSGIYNSKSSFNSLNQFIQGEKITKDLNPDYGSIQKLFTRNTNVVVLCEDKTLKVLANKDALFNADGNVNLTSTNNVLGQVVPFVGEFGISTNPESFASFGYRCYYADRKRGAVIRLSGDGITDIAEKGMSKFFRDNLDNSLVIKGSYDSLKDNYNLTLNDKTVSFTEKVNGWTAFKSFKPESGISYSNSYYTFNGGEIYMHGESATRNNFYGTQYDSTLKLVFNSEPDTVKDFKTINYEGDSGWTANTITTDKESGSVSSFIEKEGKYFNFIKGVNINNDVDLLKTSGLNVQGIGKPSSVNANSNTSGSQHVITAVDIATNKEPKRWIFNNSATDTTSTDSTIKINLAQGSNVVPTADFYVHPQTVKGVAWKLSTTDFTFNYAESISDFAGVVSVTLEGSGSLRVRIVITSNPWPTADTTSTLTMTAGSAYQEQI